MLSEQPSHVPNHDGEMEDLTNEAEVCDPSENEDGSVTEEEVIDPPTQLNQSETVNATDEISASQDDAPKKSYASIVCLTFLGFEVEPFGNNAEQLNLKCC